MLRVQNTEDKYTANINFPVRLHLNGIQTSDTTLKLIIILC